MLADPRCSIRATTRSRRACGFSRTSRKARKGLSAPRPRCSGRSRTRATQKSMTATVTRDATSARSRCGRSGRIGGDQQTHPADRDERAAHEGDVPPAEDAVPVVVAHAELGSQGGVRHGEDRHRRVEADDTHRHPNHQRGSRERLRRAPHHQEDHHDRHQRGEHPGAPAPDSRIGPVGEVPGQRIRDAVPDSRDPEDQPHHTWRDQEHVGRELHQVHADEEEHEPDARGGRCVDQDGRERGPLVGVTHAPETDAPSET